MAAFRGKKAKITGITGIGGSFKLSVDNGVYAWSETFLDHVAATKPIDTIIITSDGVTTTACRKHNGKTVNTSAARLSVEDDYNFEYGAQLCFNRLLYGTDYHPSEVALTQEKVSYNGFVVCTEENPPATTKGKIYAVKDGRLRFDDGVLSPKFESFDDLAANTYSKWIEVIEDDDGAIELDELPF